MKAKILITVGIAGWLILIVLILYFSVWKPQIAKHRAEAFNQGVVAVQNNMLQQLETQDFVRIIIDGEDRILREEKKKKRKR